PCPFAGISASRRLDDGIGREVDGVGASDVREKEEEGGQGEAREEVVTEVVIGKEGRDSWEGEQDGARSMASAAGSWGRERGGGRGYARCHSCRGEVVRTMEAMEAHEAACNGEGGRYGGRERKSPWTRSQGTPRILYRRSSPPLAPPSAPPTLPRPFARQSKPWEACVLQDSFVDREGGAVFLYEMSVRHGRVEGSPGHAPVEVLVVLYVARPLARPRGEEAEACELTVISQVAGCGRGGRGRGGGSGGVARGDSDGGEPA
ncbi:hypothetical protein Naga_102507g1, partial [Nannochloropsis gaditana]